MAVQHATEMDVDFELLRVRCQGRCFSLCSCMLPVACEGFCAGLLSCR